MADYQLTPNSSEQPRIHHTPKVLTYTRQTADPDSQVESNRRGTHHKTFEAERSSFRYTNEKPEHKREDILQRRDYQEPFKVVIQPQQIRHELIDLYDKRQLQQRRTLTFVPSSRGAVEPTKQSTTPRKPKHIDVTALSSPKPLTTQTSSKKQTPSPIKLRSPGADSPSRTPYTYSLTSATQKLPAPPISRNLGSTFCLDPPLKPRQSPGTNTTTTPKVHVPVLRLGAVSTPNSPAMSNRQGSARQHKSELVKWGEVQKVREIKEKNKSALLERQLSQAAHNRQLRLEVVSGCDNRDSWSKNSRNTRCWWSD